MENANSSLTGPLDGRQILVVEDDHPMAMLYSAVLTRAGAVVETADTGALALKKAEARSWDLLILDMHLRDMTGIDFLKSRGAKSSIIPTIVITSHADLEIALSVIPFGIASYHLKSKQTVDSLVEIVRAAIEVQELRSRLLASERNLRAVYDTAPYAMCVINRDTGNVVEVNPAFSRLFGEGADLSGDKLESLLGVLLAVDPDTTQAVPLNLSGKHLLLEVTAAEITRDGTNYLLAHFRDLSTAVELEQTRDRMELLLSQSDLLCLFVNIDGTIEEWNQGAEKALGYTRNQMVGTKVWELVHPKLRESVQLTWPQRSVDTTGPESRWMITHRAASGEILTVEWNRSILRDQKERVTGVAVFGTVVTKDREAELRARVLFEEALTGILLVDENNDAIVDVNPIGAAYFGIQSDVLKGSSFLGLFDVDERPILRQKLDSLQRTQGAISGQARASRRGGTSFLFAYRASRISVAGKPLTLVMGRDVSEIWRAESRYQELFERSLEPILITEPVTSRIIDCNPALEKLTGRTREELLETTSISLRPAPDRERIEGLVAKTGHDPDGTQREYPSRFLHKQGHIVDVIIRSSRFSLEGRSVFISFVRDVTAEKVAEARYKQMFFEGREPIVIIDPSSGSFIDGNPAFENLTGYRLSELQNLKADDLIAETEQSGVRLIARSETLLLRCKDGDLVDVAVRSSQISDKHGIALMAIFRDLRPERREADLERSLNQMQKMQSLGLMASGIAHDFNNTLMSALPWADLIRRKYPDDETLQKSADHIRKAVHRAKEVTRQLLDFAQPKRPQMQSLRLSEILSEQLKMIRPALPPEIEIVTEFSAEDPKVAADPAQLSQIVLNLALNARDAMPDGGELRFATRAVTPQEASRWNVAGSRFLMLTVCDTGTGISRAALEKIFDPFFTTKDIGKGTGLGLSVVHRIAAQHGGSIFVESEIGKGTTFFLLLPLSGSEKSSSPVPASISSAPADKYLGLQFLIIDDEEIVAEGLRAILESEGAQVTLASRGAVALRLLDSGFKADVVILDLGLPEMSGETIHGEIRKRLPELPILISSGYGEASRIDPILRDGFTRFKQKPYEMEELFAEIDQFSSFQRR